MSVEINGKEPIRFPYFVSAITGKAQGVALYINSGKIMWGLH